MTAEEGSIALAKDRLRLWLDHGTCGMARLEYVSQFSRAEVVKSLRGVVRVEEVVLEAGSTAEQVAEIMIEAVRRAAGAEERTVVSFSAVHVCACDSGTSCCPVISTSLAPPEGWCGWG